ncbi:membrane protein [Sulfuricaulis limicola]|uniref:Outer-membrane lipoprotein LolB n=1 Tax=Sulfuricaulis limicola TaxID=1620215 RepID=A0A1B4XDZ9_9GAMM|nr:lipoprotein insertase outer membrane protein LolB [Sulfuricaulis limicola]BAV33036.1 membrane protein [Sulfuricaulis limicola]
MRPIPGLVIIFVSLLSGCATAPLPPAADLDPVWQARQAALVSVTAWQLRGRLALRAADQGGHATLSWKRDGERHRMDFTGPLGRGHLRLTQDSQGAELRDADRRVWRAADAGRLLYRATGWIVPLDGLNYWVLGLPAPGPVANLQLDEQGRLKRLLQSGWDIQFLEYTRHGAFDLPSKMYITRQDRHADGNPAEGEILEVRLSIEQWTLP